MRRLIALLATAFLVSSTPGAQTRPDFSGRWIMDEARSVTPTHEGFVGPVSWLITQTAQDLTVQITRGPKTLTLTYELQDKPPTAPAADRRDPQVALNVPKDEGVPSYRGYWDGDTLVTETAQNISGQTVTTREVRTLRAGGREMIVERIVEVEHGYTLRGAQNYNTAKDIFKKVDP